MFRFCTCVRQEQSQIDEDLLITSLSTLTVPTPLSISFQKNLFISASTESDLVISSLDSGDNISALATSESDHMTKAVDVVTTRWGISNMGRFLRSSSILLFFSLCLWSVSLIYGSFESVGVVSRKHCALYLCCGFSVNSFSSSGFSTTSPFN